MAYVAPNGTIQLFRSVDLTPAYTDTIWFPNISTQTSVFEAQVDYQFTNQMYTRVSGNKVRVHIVADEIRDCSYMRFQNIRNNKSKWFYAFITNIEYINEQVTEITYEIDEIQSWYFEDNDNNHFSKCFIERQHAENDDVGDNIVPEPLNVSENIVCSKEFYWYGESTYYLMVLGLSSISAQLSGFDRSQYGGLASTVHYILFTNSTSLHTFVHNATFDNGYLKGLFSGADIWSILAVYAVPSRFFNGSEAIVLNNATVYKMSVNASTDTKTISRPYKERGSTHGNSSGGTYLPKNNKMFTYPFCFFRVASPINEQDYKYENFFTQSNIPTYKFVLKSACNPEPALLITPKDYNGEDNDFRYSLNITGFPLLTVYQNTQSGEIVGKAIRKLSSALVGGSLIAATGGNAIAIAEMANEGSRGSNTPPIMTSSSPSISSGGTNELAPQFAASGLPAADDVVFEVAGYRMGLRKETAELFDNYLSRYGYAQNKVDVPNVHARGKWTYVKTRDCRCTVNAPASSLKKINDVMNNGITWWDFQTSVGNYGDFTNPHSVG